MEEMARFGKPEQDQQEIARIIADVVDSLEDDLREELKQKHYHADLNIPASSEP
jgi:hypothetical protein